MRRRGALQALVGAHDADVVPHQAADLVPVLGDDDRLVGRRRPRPRTRARPAAGASLARRARRRRRARANTSPSSSELEARRQAPCSPVIATSPIAYRLRTAGAAVLVGRRRRRSSSARPAPPGSAACACRCRAACSARGCWGSARPGTRRTGGSCRGRRESSPVRFSSASMARDTTSRGARSFIAW